MSLLVLSISVVSLLVLVATLWICLHLHYMRRLDAAQARHEQQRRESNEALGAAQSRLASVRQQLLDAQMELKRVARLVPATSPAAPRSSAVESLLTMLDDESKACPVDDQGFDKTLKFDRLAIDTVRTR